MSDNKLIATIKVYYNPVSRLHSTELWEDGRRTDGTSGNMLAISDWLFCVSLSLEDANRGN